MSDPTPRTRKGLRSALLAGLLTVAALAAAPATAASAAGTKAAALPNSIASMGDSITRGFNACGWYVDCPSRSFSTGTTNVNSHYQRLLARNPAIKDKLNNDAESGATAADMPGQADKVVAQQAEYVTLLIGANDACADTEAGMTPVATYRASIDSALAKLKAGVPNARILIVSIPDLKRLWQAGSGNLAATAVWSLFGVCQSMLANATSTSTADSQRRDRVRQRVVDYNTQLASACSAYGSNCKFDGNAVFNYPFTLSQVSQWDYFHPNESGQAILSTTSNAAGYNW
jgi:lysophospholipase L1-like esterase